MKRLLSVLFLLLAFSTYAQKGSTIFLISYREGEGQIKEILTKAETLSQYVHGLTGKASKSTAIEIGFSLLNHQYECTKFDMFSKITSVNQTVNALVFPKLRFDILRYFFISSGFLLNADIDPIDDIDMGVSFGVGIQCYFKNKAGIFIYPQKNIHKLSIGLVEKHNAFGITHSINKA